MSKHIDLMRLHDGELSEEEVAELERELTESELRVLEGLEDLGERIRVANGHESVDLTDAIMGRLDQPAPAPVRELRPRSNGAWVAGGLVLAAAAAVAFWFSNRGHEAPPVAQAPTTVVAPAPSPERAPKEAVLENLAEDEEIRAPAASIEAVDFGNRNGTIFMVPSEKETTPVVWLADEAAENSRMEPL